MRGDGTETPAMPDDSFSATRRGLIRASGLSAMGLAIGAAGGASSGAPGYPAPSEMDIGRVQNGRVVFPNWRSEAEPRTPPPPAPRAPGSAWAMPSWRWAG